MLLARLRIRGKLALLVAVPLLAMFGLVVPVVIDLVGSAGRAAEIDAAVQLTERVGPLVEDLQQERLLSIGYLLGAVDRTDLARQSARVTDQLTTVRAAGDVPDELATALDAIEQRLPQLRLRIRNGSATPIETLDAFVPFLDDSIEALALDRLADASTAAGQELLTLDALLQANESLTETTAILAIMAHGDPEALVVRYHEETTELALHEDRFAEFTTPAQAQLYGLVAAAFEERLGKDFGDDFDADPRAAMAEHPLAELFPKLRSFSVLGGYVEKRLIDDLSSAVSRDERQALSTAYAAGAVTALVLLVVLLLVASVGRAVAAPLIRLTRSAERLAEAGEEELRRVADDEVETGAPIRLDVLGAGGADEIGDLARAFDRVQTTAAQLVERQVVSRRNVAEMFGHIGRRTQNLVGRQLGIIDQLESRETDGPRLEQLYRLDHLSNRLRRSADSLVVISGGGQSGDHMAPVRLIDVARLALAQIEEYTRVDTDIPIELLVAPGIVGDLVLLVAELLENASNFSPPHTRVTVAARAVPGGVRIVVVDNGIGMSDERLAEENARLVRRERLDLVPSRVLGLFVAGRLARRHGFNVALAHTPAGGVTATVDLGPSHVILTPVAAVPARYEAIDDGPTREIEPPRATAVALAPQPTRRLQDAGEAMRDWRPWNAFETRAPLVVPPSAPSPATPPAVPQPPAPITSPSGLRRRVPGQQLPTGPERVEPEAPPGVGDALAARALIEEFEAGVRRAGEDTVVVEQRPLRRRDPGASLAGVDRPSRAPEPAAAPLDPQAVRSLVEQFETGVARALRDAPDGTDPSEGTPR